MLRLVLSFMFNHLLRDLKFRDCEEQVPPDLAACQSSWWIVQDRFDITSYESRLSEHCIRLKVAHRQSIDV